MFFVCQGFLWTHFIVYYLTFLKYKQNKDLVHLVLEIAPHKEDNYKKHVPSRSFSNILRHTLWWYGIVKYCSKIKVEVLIISVTFTHQVLPFCSIECICKN